MIYKLINISICIILLVFYNFISIFIIYIQYQTNTQFLQYHLAYMIQDTQAYIIKSKHSGKVLSIGKQLQLKGNAVIYKYQNGFHQQFYLRQNGPLLEIINVQSKRALTVTDGSLNNGQDKGLDWQKFRFQQVSPESNQYIIYTFCGKVLDCFEYSRSNGTNVVQWEFNGGDNQKWILEKLNK